MHPAFSVIFFSTLSGAGYGLLAWCTVFLAIGWRDALRGQTPALFVVALLAAFVLVTVGLLSSLGHLGRPARAWRAFSQWRSSWLSREGVAAVFTYLPLVVLIAALTSPWWPALLDGEAVAPGDALPVSALLALPLAFAGALLTVVCTAMIYASLKPIPAWRHRAVLPAYLGFALLTGGLPLAALTAAVRGPTPTVEVATFVLLALAVGLFVLKRRYWRDIDRDPLPVTRASALGLRADRVATVFERPHTEANYLTKEMGFVVARRHADRLRRVALALFAIVPAVACALVLLWPPLAAPALGAAALSALLGAVVERWLFFAQARHLVTLYY